MPLPNLCQSHGTERAGLKGASFDPGPPPPPQGEQQRPTEIVNISAETTGAENKFPVVNRMEERQPKKGFVTFRIPVLSSVIMKNSQNL